MNFLFDILPLTERMLWIGSNQWSNHPGQNSLTRIGRSGCSSRSLSMLAIESYLKLAVIRTGIWGTQLVKIKIKISYLFHYTCLLPLPSLCVYRSLVLRYEEDEPRSWIVLNFFCFETICHYPFILWGHVCFFIISVLLKLCIWYVL